MLKFRPGWLRALLSMVCVVSTLALPAVAFADWRDWLNTLTNDDDAVAGVAAELAESDIADGLREALGNGVRTAVNELGRKDGFLANADVRIPVPKHLQTIESGLRGIGQDGIADQFVSSMNRAAEGAVPHAADVFANAISTMSIDDARGILKGEPTAATDYLRRSSHGELEQRFRPLVEQAMAQVGVTHSYQSLLQAAGPLSAMIDTDKLDLSRYVTDEALSGLYTVIAEQEKQIRANPAARTTDLLKKVFGN